VAARLRVPFGVLFALQFVLLDAVLRGPQTYLAQPRIFVSLIESALVWALVLSVATTRRRRIAAAIVAATLVVFQAFVFRFYRAPFDVQVAATAIHAWRDVEPVLVRALPSFLGAAAGVAAIEYVVLVLAKRERASLWLLPALALAGLFGPPLRMATPDVRAVHALRAFAQKREPVVAGAVALPPLHSDRSAVPNVLFVLSESIRASDYVLETTPELRSLPGRRFDLRQMRSVASYTAVSLSALLTGRSQEGPREDILRSPSLFDIARATRDAKGGEKRPFVGYFSAQLRDIFETKNVWAAVDEMKALEDLVGKNLEEADQPTEELPLDRMVVDELDKALAQRSGAAVAVLHFGGTHAPYYCDPKDAPFQPVVHYASWRDMAMLHNAYKNAIHHQDRALAVGVRAFAERSKAQGRPWMVVFTSDHGDAFAEHGAIHHGQNLYDEQVHVPGWILVGEGTLTDSQERALREHESKFVTHLDLLPTVLDAMGLWDNTAMAAHRANMAGRSMLRLYEARGPIPVTNCTTMFPCPLNTWGVYDDDHKLVAHIWDGAWECLIAGDEEKAAPAGDAICPRLAEVSRRHFPLLPNGTPNR
jgi:hypothetical protein